MQDYDYRKGLQSSQRETVEIIAEAFLEAMPGDFESMKKAAEAGDWKSLGILAHAAKGLFMTFGAEPLSDAMSALEKMSILEGSNIDQAKELVRASVAQWELLKPALEDINRGL